VVRAEASAQHYLCDHTWDHTSLEDMPEDQFVQEANDTKEAIL
jgi:peptidoglycan/xylan/chitin deacetylase (PgdA/CDA1 family)